MKRAVAYLENMQPNVGRVYVKAVIAYALALADSPLKLNANQDLLNSARYDAGTIRFLPTANSCIEP